VTPYWQLSDLRERRPSWELSEPSGGTWKGTLPCSKRRPSIYRTVLPSPELIERDGADGTSTLNLRFAIFDRWQLIDNPSEGPPFLEKIQRGAFSKTIRENLANVRAVLSHGKDPSLGNTVLGTVDRIEEEPDGASARVSLFRSVPELLLDGLRAGVYGASFRGAAIKSHVEPRPGRSPHNPDGIAEVTRKEIALADIGPTPFAAYKGTSARIGDSAMALSMRSLPDEPERPYWQLGDGIPAWQLKRGERHRGHTYAKT
jgi:phage head maturation protease